MTKCYYSLHERAKYQTVALQDELRRQIEFILLGRRVYVPIGELERLTARLSKLEAVMARVS